MNDTTSHADQHTRDLRKGRFSESGRTYLITTVVHNRRPIFAEWQIGRLLVDELRATEKSGLVQSLAWVVMPDHLHWLVTLQSGNLPALI
jgi:REP element-mobilizing transposase RayT